MKTALVTGANKGIGFEIARQFGNRGLHVIIAARDSERGAKAAGILRQEGATATFIQMDVTDQHSINRAVEQLRELNLKLDILVNNAGILLEQRSVFPADLPVLQQTLDVNVFGVYRVTDSFLTLITDGGRIINVSSGLGSLKSMSDYASAYSLSKAALNALTKQFAAALASRKISVNSVCPGWVKTDMGGSGAPRTTQQGAETPVWLALDAAPELTGQFYRDKKVIEW